LEIAAFLAQLAWLFQAKKTKNATFYKGGFLLQVVSFLF
jgi:hypothetical protein